jgi:hypothetical protein
MFIVTYSIVLQNIKTKYFVFRPAPKRQILSKLKNFEFFTVHHLRSGNLSILCSLKYIIIRVDFLHTCRVHHYLHSRFFFRFFRNFKLSISKKFENRAPGSPSSELTLSACCTVLYMCCFWCCTFRAPMGDGSCLLPRDGHWPS